jgi:L-threonylcarbamoyladenylate synthase
MQIIKLNNNNRPQVLALAHEVIDRGGTVVYPTETSYALGGDFFSDKAYKRILSIKSRPKDKSFPVIVGTAHQARVLVKFTPVAERLAEKFWPGPLTLVLPLQFLSVNSFFTTDSLALRISSHPLAQDLSRIVARPLISTSANIAGQPAVYTVRDLIAQLANRSSVPDLIIDAGELEKKPASTIIKISDSGVEVLREGSIIIPKSYYAS